jgi:hypothetical protein
VVVPDLVEDVPREQSHAALPSGAMVPRNYPVGPCWHTPDACGHPCGRHASYRCRPELLPVPGRQGDVPARLSWPAGALLGCYLSRKDLATAMALSSENFAGSASICNR